MQRYGGERYNRPGEWREKSEKRGTVTVRIFQPQQILRINYTEILILVECFCI